MSEYLIPARPTTYRGIPMRSRLEARVAAGLDDRGFDWEYEPNAFGGRGGQYLPDFLLHGTAVGDAFLEVKPTVETALAVLPKMQIIRESIPDAFLIVQVVGIGAYQLRRGEDRWRWFLT